MTTRVAGRTLQRNIESARPASSATITTYTTYRDATVEEGVYMEVTYERALLSNQRPYG
jgi:hypothetical protein